jgi:O-antigen/teichoic acid export membrane protein
VLKNILSNWVGIVILGMIGIFLTPIMVHGVGNLYYGMWILAASIGDYSGLLDLGMRTTIFRFVAYYRGGNQRSALDQAFATGLAISMLAMLASFIGVYILSLVLPPFFHFTGEDRRIFATLVILLGSHVAVAFPSQFFSSYLRGLERFDLYNLGLVLSGVLRGIFLIGLIKMGYGIIPVGVAALTVGVIGLGFHWILVKRADPELRLALAHLTWVKTKEMLNYGFYSFVTNSGEMLRYYTDSIVIGRVLNVALITQFGIATRLMDYFKTVSGGVSGPIMVRLSELSGAGHDEAQRREFLRFTRFSMLLCALVGGLLILDGKLVIQIWMGNGFADSYPILVVLTVAYIVTFGQVPCQLVVFARGNNHKTISWWTLAEGVVNLVLSVYWARTMGLVGVALGTAVPLMVSKLFIQPWYALHDLGIRAWDYVLHGLARATGVGGIFLAAGWFIADRIAVPVNFLGLVEICSLQSLVFVALIYLLGLHADDRSDLRQRMRRLASALRFGKAA